MKIFVFRRQRCNFVLQSSNLYFFWRGNIFLKCGERFLYQCWKQNYHHQSFVIVQPPAHIPNWAMSIHIGPSLSLSLHDCTRRCRYQFIDRDLETSNDRMLQKKILLTFEFLVIMKTFWSIPILVDQIQKLVKETSLCRARCQIFFIVTISALWNMNENVTPIRSLLCKI